MASIFDLKTSVSELKSANQGTSRMEYDQQAPTRDVTGQNFANGAIHFRYETSGPRWHVPCRTYMRTRLQATKQDGTPLVLADDIAAAMGLMSSLFQSMEFKIADKIVSRVSDFCAQVDALETRLSKSSSWLDKLGGSTNFWQDEFRVRQAEISSDGLYVPYVTRFPTSSQMARTQVGLDAAGGAGNDRNALSYVSATGILTLAQNGGAALPAATSVLFNVGDYIAFTLIQGAAVGDQREGVPLRVISFPSATTIQTSFGTIGDVAVDGRTDFVRIRGPPASQNDAQQAGTYELVWQPPLSIFKVGHALPSGKYELVLNPQTAPSYPLRAIQSSLTGKVANTGTTGAPVAGSNFKINIVDMYLYCAMVEGPRADNITYLLDLEQTRCQSEKIDSISFGQKNFDVSPSSYALTVAYQDLRGGSDTRVSPCLFRSYTDVLTDGTVPVPQELGLNRFYLNYAGQNLPNPDADPSFVAGTEYTIQRYLESQIYNGAFYDSGGAEDIVQFHKRGAYYYFSWPKDGTDRSTRVTVHQQFAGGTQVANMRVLLFDHSRQVAKVQVKDGRVIDVQLEDA